MRRLLFAAGDGLLNPSSPVLGQGGVRRSVVVTSGELEPHTRKNPHLRTSRSRQQS
jgi:hypothetical protein